MPMDPGQRRPRREWALAIGLALVTAFTATTLGAAWYLSTRVAEHTDLLPWLSPRTVVAVWTDPTLLSLGARFALPTLFILLVHELGHWGACRRAGLPATPPFFLPAPIGLGTFGAFIRIRGPIRDRRLLFDVGASGPLAGFLALLPCLLLGVARSRPVPVVLDASGDSALALLQPGSNLLLTGVTHLLHGPLPAGQVLELHPLALAAWVGMLATALHLLPLGQLDGGHIVYAVFGRAQRRLAPVLALTLAAFGFAWPGWWLWSLVLLVLGWRHPPVLDESLPLDRGRRFLAAVCGLLLLLCFLPVPVEVLNLAP